MSICFGGDERYKTSNFISPKFIIGVFGIAFVFNLWFHKSSEIKALFWKHHGNYKQIEKSF